MPRRNNRAINFFMFIRFSQRQGRHKCHGVDKASTFDCFDGDGENWQARSDSRWRGIASHLFSQTITGTGDCKS